MNAFTSTPPAEERADLRVATGPSSNEEPATLAQAMRQAQSWHDAGEQAKAEQLCRWVLAEQPDHFDALHLLGVITAGTQRAADAVELLARAVAARPADALAHRDYGEALRSVRRLDEALESYARALEISPDDAAAHNGRAATLRALGRFAEGLDSCARALALRPAYAEAQFNRGVILQYLGRSVEALESYQHMLQIWPETAEACYNCGILLHELERFDEALQSYARALEIRPNYADAYTNRAHLLSCLGRLEEALDDLERARSLKPESAEIYINLGNVLRRLGRPEEALAHCQRALVMVPDSPEAHLNHGAVYYDRNEPGLAVESYSKAIAIRADFAGAYQNRGYAALLAGDYINGWADHEWRWSNHKDPLSKDRRNFGRPLWLGSESLCGKTILLHAEQGFGDTLQFCRYARWVADLGATVILETPEFLASLLRNLDGIARLVIRGEPLPSFDFHCPLMSLPLAFKTVLATIPARVPYLKSDPGKVLLWNELLGERRRLRVGLVWSGGFRPDQPELWSVNQRRNIPLAKLAPLRHPDVQFYSLQKGRAAEAELTDLVASNWEGPTLIDFTRLLNDFSDTAALLENLDLVISVDTATVHVAGALGKPVWLLNRFDTCWRWLLHRTDSPWYPTVVIYRQDQPGDWDAVVQRVSADLSRLIERRAASRA
ncbi:MAG: tetratricopeptide repeat protein [Steroidobacteraceae bacterium]